ncbi:MAG TPA: TonB-dependent receptor, partial [Xanthomonadales bacterium]|nr:TonB-dependent receptor [Xanthomonadales bacterium]
EASYVWGQTRVDLGTEGLVSTSALYYGLRVEEDPANPGNYRCIDPGARATGCIPINPFNYTQEMVDALNLNSVSEGTSELDNAVAYLAGDAFELPAGFLQTVVGVEFRKNTGYLNYDTIINQGLATGNQIQDVDKSIITTKEIFLETLVPILAGQPFAERLDIEAAYRWTDADELGDYDTWKLGLNWAPVESLRFRAMAAKAVRAPVPSELSGIGQTFGVVNDPCTQARRNANPTRAANCAAAGVPADYNPGQIIEQSVSGLTGGNPDLLPEEGKTYTYGLVWTPDFANFNMSLDRFDMKMDGIIDFVARQSAVNFCYDQGLYCDTLTRGTNPLLPGATYVLTSANQQLLNVAEYSIKGWDLTAGYSFDIGGAGNIGLQLNMVFYDEAQKTPIPGEAAIDLLGQAGGDTSDQGFIETTGNLDINWSLRDWHANWGVRYIGSADMAVGTTEAGFPKMESKWYHNFQVGWSFNEGSSEIYAGMNNVFDEEPQLMCSGCSGTQALDIVPGYYDPFGVSWYLGFRWHFGGE